MEIKTWDKSEIQDQFSHCPTLKEIIGAVEKAAESLGRVVCSISINGSRLTEREEGVLAHTLREDIDVIEVAIEAPSQLVADTLVSLRVGMLQIRDRGIEISEEFRKGVFSSAQRGFCTVMEQTQYTMDALRALKPRLRVSSSDGAQTWQAAEQQSQAMIAELMQAYSDKDYVLVADVLEYELYNSMEAWIKALDTCDFD
jgi:hypothetical protein